MELKHLSVGTSVAMILVLTVVMMSVQESESRPSIADGWIQYHNRFNIHDPQRRASFEQCEDSSRDVRSLCQRCAKVTKSKLAYPMCCENRENSREWCRQLLVIGVGSY